MYNGGIERLRLTKVNSMSVVSEFIEYFFDFYGADGIYPETLPVLTKNELLQSMVDYMANPNKPNFEGDSIDRELIRDLIIDARDLVAVN